MRTKLFFQLVLLIFGLLVAFLQSSTPVSASEKLTVGTIERPPFTIKNPDGSLRGFSVELFQDIARRIGIDHQFREYDVFSDMIQATRDGLIDLSIANISITSDREKVMDFSQPIYDSGLQILVPKKSGNNAMLTAVLEAGILKFIAFALGILLVIAHLLWFFELKVENRRHDYFRDDYLGGIWDAFWWAFIIMTMGGFENEVPHKKISRALAMFWIVVSLFFISTLTAKITTALTVAELQSNISSYRDLPGKKVGIPKGPTILNFLQENGVDPIEYIKLDNLFSDLLAGKLDAVVHDAPIASYFATHRGKGNVLIAGEKFRPEKYGILFQEDSKLKEQVDQAIIAMYEDGSYAKLYRKYFGE